MHRDIKPENILLEEEKGFDRLKVIDFGTAQQVELDEDMNVTIGTPHYIAPEVLDESYGLKCDIWSCGILAYVLLSGRLPFDGHSVQDIFRNVREAPLMFPSREWKNLSRSARDFVIHMLNRDKNDRPTAI